MALISGLRNTLLPAKQSTTNVVSRVDDYGGSFVIDSMLAPDTQALEGSKFVARAIPAVGGVNVVLGSFPTVFSDTLKLSLSLRNNEVAGGKSYVIDYIRARCTAAGSTTSSVEARAEVDTINRYTSGGTALVVYKANPSTSASASLATAFSGDITAPAASVNRQHIGSCLVKKAAGPCLVVDETFLFTFGTIGQQLPYVAAGPVATTMIAASYPFSSACVPAGGTFLFQLALIANATTPAGFEFEIGWAEK